MNKRKLINKYDVEKYDILIPFKNIFGHTKKVFLYSELEKRHPCFSDEFCFDVLFRKLSKKGLFTDVFVMNKLKLAEYEGKQRIPGMGLGIENQKKRIFVSQKWRLIICGVLPVIFLSVFSLAFNLMLNKSDISIWNNSADLAKNAGPENLKNEERLNYSGDVEISEAREVVKSVAANPCLLLLEVLKKNSSGAAVSKVEWRTDGFTERFSANLKNVFPEELEEKNGLSMDGGPVNYSEGVPHMQVSWMNRGGRGKDVAAGKDGAALLDGAVPARDGAVGRNKASDGRSFAVLSREVRKVLWADGAAILSESFSPYSIEFKFPGTSVNTSDFFKKLSDLIKSTGYIVSAVTVFSENQKELNVNLTAGPADFNGLDISLLDSCLNYFDLSKVWENQNQPLPSPLLKQEDLIPVLKKIGEIHSGDGSIVIFYKNADGKLIRKKEVL